MNKPDEFDRQITQAMETVPLVTVPDGFARRVSSRLPQRRAVTSPLPAFRYTWARGLSFLCAAVLVIALFALALSRHAGPSLLEMLLTAELAMITLGLFLRRST